MDKIMVHLCTNKASKTLLTMICPHKCLTLPKISSSYIGSNDTAEYLYKWDLAGNFRYRLCNNEANEFVGQILTNISMILSWRILLDNEFIIFSCDHLLGLLS